MNDPKDSFDPVARLLREAGPRKGPSPEAFDRIRSKVHADWRREVDRRRRARWSAIAASIAVLAAGAWWATPRVMQDTAPSMVATVVQGGAGVTVHRAELATPVAVVAGMAIEKGDRVSTTAASGATFSIDGKDRSIALRLSPGSTLEWLAANELQLVVGGAYLDVGRRGTSADFPLVVEAGGVRISHVGTQYLATVLPDGGILVAVRDGQVRVQGADSTLTLDRGERVRMRQGVAPERDSIDADDAEWAWVDALAPTIRIQGRSLLAVVRELAGESGLDLAFAEGSLEREMAATSLQGPDLKLPPRQGLQRVLSTTLFRAEIDGASGRVVVRRR